MIHHHYEREVVKIGTYALTVAVFVGVATGVAQAHGNGVAAPAKQAAPAEQKPFGIAGDPKRVDRTIEIRMTDRMRYEPSSITVKAGETIRFVHRNIGKVMHEMVIGTRKDLEEHAQLMRKQPGMEHDEPYMTHVAAGKRGQMVWQFNRVGDFEFACLIPGHFEAGMRGTIKVAAK